MLYYFLDSTEVKGKWFTCGDSEVEFGTYNKEWNWEGDSDKEDWDWGEYGNKEDWGEYLSQNFL